MALVFVARRRLPIAVPSVAFSRRTIVSAIVVQSYHYSPLLRQSSIMDPVPVTAAVQLLSVDVNGTFSITPEAESVLKGLEGPFYTVVLHGHARSGKSTLLTLLVREWFRNTPHADAAASFRFFVKTSPETASSDSGTQHGSGSRTLIKCAQWFTALRWYDADGSFRATVLLIDSEAGVYQGTVFAGFLAAQIQAVARWGMALPLRRTKRPTDAWKVIAST